MNRKLPSGHGWAYFGVALGLTASITGNVAHTYLAESTISLWLRVPLAAIWPIFLGVGIEVLTRVDWNREWKHNMAKLLLLGPVTLVSGFVSYLHLYHLMGMAGEMELAQYAGPIAVDGTLFGCTVALLVTRRAAHATDTAPRKTLAQRVAAARTSALAVAQAAKGETAVEPVALPAPFFGPEPVETPALPIPVSPAVEAIRPTSPAGPRMRGQWDAAKAVRLIQEGDLGDTDIGSVVNVSPKMIQRTRRAVRLLTQDPRATVPSEWKVPANVLDIIRREIQR